MTEAKFYLGVDGGGTKCVARLFSAEGKELGVGRGGPANAYQSLETTQSSILDAALTALDCANISRQKISQLKVGAGLAGVNVPSVLQAMQAWQHPFSELYVTTDVHIACVGAHQKNTGAIVIVGTGSCGYARIETTENKIEEFFIGGHGFPIGDQAGGAWMGFEAVRSILLSQDGLLPSTLLTEKIHRQWQTSPLNILDRISTATSADFAQLANCVFEAAEAEDNIALSIRTSAIGYLNNMIEKLYKKNTGRIALVGGLSKKIQPYLPKEIRLFLTEPIAQPEVGAFYFLQNLENNR